MGETGIHIEQREPAECLAARAAIALAYVGRATDYNRLLKLLKVQRGVGAVFSNIRELERLGVQVIYKKSNLDELREHLTGNRPPPSEFSTPIPTIETQVPLDE
jgi:hypothetical protein